MMIRFLIILFIITSCNNKQTDKKQEPNKYQKLRNTFRTEHINHFPHSASSRNVKFYGYSTNYWDDFTWAYYYKSATSYEIEILKRDIATVALKSYSSEDSLLVVNSYTSRKECGLQLKLSNAEKQTNLRLSNSEELPVPNFWELKLTKKNNCRLPNGFTLYVLDAEPGMIYIEHLKCKRYMPPKWKYGYSKGVAINESQKEIIYWFISW